MGLFDESYVYGCPMPDPGDLKRTPVYPPVLGPWPAERARERIETVMDEFDEFDVMRAVAVLPIEAQRRVFEWLRSIVNASP